MQFFSKIANGGAHERGIDGKLVGQGGPTGLKKGGHVRGTPPYPLSRSVPSGGILQFTPTAKDHIHHSYNYWCIHVHKGVTSN